MSKPNFDQEYYDKFFANTTKASVKPLTLDEPVFMRSTEDVLIASLTSPMRPLGGVVIMCQTPICKVEPV